MATLQGLPLPTPRVCPVTGGGIHFAWQVQDREVEIEILPDGSAEYLVVEKESNSGVERTLEGSLPLDRREIGQALGEWLITGCAFQSVMPERVDDPSIADDDVLRRRLLPNWLCSEGDGTVRPGKVAIMDRRSGEVWVSLREFARPRLGTSRVVGQQPRSNYGRSSAFRSASP